MAQRFARPGLLLPVTCLLFASLSLAALAVLSGQWARGGLVAEVRLAPFALPATIGIDDEEIALALSTRLQQRVERDTALRLLLGGEGRDRMREVVVPRLLNAGVIRRLIEDTPSLGAMIEAEAYRGLATVRIENRTGAELTDVAITLPEALRAERAGDAVPLARHGESLRSITLPALAANESASLTIWMAAPPEALAARAGEMRLGAVRQSGTGGQSAAGEAEAEDGIVQLRGQPGAWIGADLEIRPWARWLVAGLLALLGALAASGALLALVAPLARRFGRP